MRRDTDVSKFVEYSGIYFSDDNRYCVANSETLPSRILNTREHD